MLKFKVDLIDNPASLRLYNMLETDLYLITTQYGTQNYMDKKIQKTKLPHKSLLFSILHVVIKIILGQAS